MTSKSSETFLPAPLCKHGMRDCPVKQCSFRKPKPTVLYSSALKGPTPTAPAQNGLTATGGPLAEQHQFGTHDKVSGEARRFQHASPAPSHPTANDSAAPLSSSTLGTGANVGPGSVDPADGSGLVQGKIWPISLMPNLTLPQPQTKSRSIAAGLKAKWMSRRLRSRR